MAAEPIPPGERLRVNAAVARCADVRRHVRTAGSRAGLAGQALDDIVCATDEAVTNAIVHGYRGAPGWIEIWIRRVHGGMEVTVRDDAPSFDPTLVPAPDLDTPFHRRRPGGYGVHLMRELADEVRHRVPPGGGNEVTLVKRLAEEEGATDGHAH
jgi:serine/threonine-protein kinase RsbW